MVVQRQTSAVVFSRHKIFTSRKKSLMALSAATAFAGWAASSRADTFGNIWTTDGHLTTLNTSTAWTDETASPTDSAPPGASDVAQFDSGTGLTAATTFTLGSNTTWGGVSVVAPGAAVVIGGGSDTSNTLTLGAFGVNMSSAVSNLTISDTLVFSTSATVSVATGVTFTQSTTSTFTSSPTLTFTGAGNSTFTGAMTGGSSSVVVNGTGTVTFSAANSYTGNTTVTSGELYLNVNSTGSGVNTSAGTGTLVLNGGSVLFNGSVSGNNGFYNPIQVNTGTTSTILSGTQLAGPITGNGTLNISDGAGNLNLLSTGSAGGGILSGFTGTINLGTSSALFGFTDAANTPITGGTFNLNLGTSTADFASYNQVSSTSTISFGSLAGGPSTLLEGDRKNATGVTTIYQIGGGSITSSVFQGTIENGIANTATTPTGLIMNGVGDTLILTGTNTFTGGTTITAGTLQIGNATASGTIGTGAVTDNAVLVLNRSDNGLTGTGSLANAISGGGSLINNGTGTVTLSGVNSYSAGTTINAGLLQGDNATNAMGSGTVTVNSGAAIGGIGTITGGVSIASGGTLQPGDAGISHGSGAGVGTLSAASVTLAASSILYYNFSPAANSLTNITTANGLTVNGGGIDLITAGTSNPFDTNGIYDIFQFPSPYTAGSVANLLTILDPQGGVTYQWGTSGNDITLQISGGGGSTSWNNTGGGSWALTASNWTSGIPNSAGGLATFGTILAASSTVTLDGNETVGNLVFNNSSASYTIAPGNSPSNTLIIDNGGSSATGFIYDTNGNHIITAPMTLNSNLQVGISNSSNTFAISGAIGGVGGITDSSNGLLILSGNNSYGGGTTILSGTIQVGTGGASGSLGTSTAPIANAGGLAFDLSSSLNVPSAITGVGTVSMSSTGTVTLSGTNTYSGNTTINGGTIQYGTADPAALSSGKLVFAGNGILDVNGNNVTLSTISGTTGKIDNVVAGGTPTVTISSSVAQSFSGVIADTTGTLSLVKAGSGQLTLGGVNTYLGPTTISAGSVLVTNSSALSTGTITVGSTNGLQLANGVNLSNTIVANAGNAEFEDVPTANSTATISGNIVEGAGDPQFRFSTSGGTAANPTATLVLTGQSVSNQEDIFTRGNIVFASSGSLTDTSSSLLAIGRSGATANMNLTIENNASVANTGTGGISIDGLDGSSDDQNTNVTIENNGSLSAGTGVLNLNDSLNANAQDAFGVVITMSNNANITAGSFTELAASTVTTNLNINSGTLTAGASSVSWFPSLSNKSGALQVALSGELTVNNAGFGISIAQPFQDNGGYVNYTGSGTTTLSVSQNFANSDTLTGGTLLISGTVALGGLSTTSSGTLGFNLGSGAGPIITNGSILTLGSNSASIASGTGLSFYGTPVIGDTYELIGGNLSGITNLNNFVLPLALSGQSFSLSNSGGYINVTVSTGPTHVSNLTWNDFSANNIWDTATSVNWSYGGLNTVFNAQDNVTFNDNNGSATGRYGVTLSSTVTPGSVTFNNSTGSYTVSGTGSIGGTGSLTKLGTGTVTLSTVNSYSGGTAISAGTLIAAATGSLPTGKAVTNNAALLVNANSTTGAINGTGTITVGPSATLSLANGSGGSSTSSLTLGTLSTLNINNNHIFINYGSGTDPIASIAALIASGYSNGTWTGSGITSATAVANASSYGIGYADYADPGNPAGLSSGQIEIAYTLLGDANLDYKVNGSDFTLMAANFNDSVTAGWDKGDFNYSNTVNGDDFVLLADNFNQFASQSALSAADLQALDDFAAANGISLTSVPEPASMGILVAAGLGVLSRRRRSRPC